jgi:hypothetical protein
MTATWTAPKTWATSELVTAALLNTHLRDNLEFLLKPPSASQDYDNGTDPTTTSTSFVAIDTGGDPDLRLSLETEGEDVAVSFFGLINGDNSGNVIGGVYLNVLVDGTTLAVADDGICVVFSDALVGPDNYSSGYFRIIISGLSAGVHTFDLMWKVSASGGTTTATLYAGAGTARKDLRPQFDVRKAA